MTRAGTCPTCGGALAFEVGSSRSAVCRFCKTLVVRRGQDFASVGKVADLVPTGSRISLGARGRYFGERFTVVGRVQLEWQQGVWDEWYVAFPDERWGWLAEAGGRYYLTFWRPLSWVFERPQAPRGEAPPAQGLPPRDEIAPGQEIELPRLGRFVVTDTKQARIVSAVGELPDEIELDTPTFTADLEGRDDAFATIDYGAVAGGRDPAAPIEVSGPDGARGAPRTEAAAEPSLFTGHEVTLDSLELRGGGGADGVPGSGGDDESITCGNCGAPITLLVPGQTVRLVCGSCNALVSAQHAGKVVAVLDRHREEPPIRIGARGTLRGAEVVVAGWMRRTCQVEGIAYPWDELLLYEPKTTTLTWLVVSEGHWSISRIVPAAQVERAGDIAYYRNTRFQRYSWVIGEVEAVLGEFPWKVRVGEQAQLEDFIAPPEGLSFEANNDEMTWSHVEHLDFAEVAAAFAGTEIAEPPPIAVGAVQPWPWAASLRALRFWIAGGIAAILLVWFAFGLRSEQRVHAHVFGGDDTPSIDPAADPSPDAPSPSRLRSYVSEPFSLHGFRAITVRVVSDVDNSWVWVDGALIKEDTGEATFFGLESTDYHGVDDGEVWSEGSRVAEKVLSAPARGSHVLRADMQWDPGRSSAPSVAIEVREGGFSGAQLLLALSLVLSPLLLYLHRRSFEKRRWENSNVSQG